MIIYNKNKIGQVLYNKNRISKILMNKKLVFSNNLSDLDIEGQVAYPMPELPGISDYFILGLMTHYPITKKSDSILQYIQDLINLRVEVPHSGINYDVVTYNNFVFGTSLGNVIANRVDGEVITGEDEYDSADYVNKTPFFNFKYTNTRVSSSEYDLGMISFYEGSLSHNLPSKALKNKEGFKVCAQMNNNQIVSLMLFGQKNIGAAEPFKSVTCDIDFEMDNNQIGTSAYNVYIYCLHSSGKYKLISQASKYNTQTNKLTLKQNLEIFNAGWFDEIEGT